MKTPICDFVSEYAGKNTLRLHMPGHKGKTILGFEEKDITEINGADSLYQAEGIIAESEKNASELFGCDTFYSTEGSSQCIRAMLYLACIYAESKAKKPLILAGRNVHKTFLSAAALLDFNVQWLYGEKESYLSCTVTPEYLETQLKSTNGNISAVYLTSPDYLGKTADIKSLSEVCHRYGALLIVDNAHGAYLKFLPQSKHPIDLGADLCCDSAHKTLPVLTGGAYLHISNSLPCFFKDNAKCALSLFCSTSPSYLILQSLDKANEYLYSEYKKDLADFIDKVEILKSKLTDYGYSLYGDEELKITIQTKSFGYTGEEFSKTLRNKGIEVEFADPDFAVLMLTPSLSWEDMSKITDILLSIKKKQGITALPPKAALHKKAMSIREAVFAQSETVPIEQSACAILADSSVGCPPAVPVVMCGEIIEEADIECFRYYGVKHCNIIKK